MQIGHGGIRSQAGRLAIAANIVAWQRLPFCATVNGTNRRKPEPIAILGGEGWLGNCSDSPASA
jgi:hypothetical protein